MLIALVLLAALAVVVASALALGPSPEARLATTTPGIGQEVPVQAVASEPWRGLETVRVLLRQGEREEVVAEQTFTPRPLWQVWGERTPEATLDLQVGKKHQPWLANGEATLVVEATRPGGILRQPAPVRQEVTLPVRVTPPTLHVLSTQTYAAQGGCEAVVYRVGEGAASHGVRAGEYFFPGQPLPGQEGAFFSLFGVPWDMETPEAIRLVAVDELGNEAQAGFIDRFTPRRVAQGRIELADPFLQKVVSEIASQTPGYGDEESLLASYLEINGALREENAEQLERIGSASRAEFLWREAFLPFPGGQVMEAFAVRRSYRYEGEEVDQQTHLGFDLASTQQAPVPASNAGVVAFAGYLGIYGNTVIVDHGYGLMTLYAHLSSIDVPEGQAVARGQSLGRTGATGLAAGDHLHFATLLRGLPVTPVEWWDGHWIQDRLARKLGAAIPFGAAAPAAGAGTQAERAGRTQ